MIANRDFILLLLFSSLSQGVLYSSLMLLGKYYETIVVDIEYLELVTTVLGVAIAVILAV
jgi:hypothetical protein